MKRLIISLLAIAVVFIMTVPAMAAKKLSKIPANMCFMLDMDNSEVGVDIRYLFLGFKTMKTIKVYGEPEKIYQAAGITSIPGQDMPIAGSAYIDNPIVQSVKAVLTTDWLSFQSLEIWWDVDDVIGYAWIYDTDSGSESYYDLTLIDCKTSDPIWPAP